MIDAVDWTYEYAWFVGLALGVLLQLAAVALVRARRGGTLPREFEPAGDDGAEAEEVPA